MFYCIVCHTSCMLAAGVGYSEPIVSDSNKRDTRFVDGSLVYDAGYIMDNDIIKHSFVLSNPTDKKLIISEIHSQCSCTVIGDKIPSEVLPVASRGLSALALMIPWESEFSMSFSAASNRCKIEEFTFDDLGSCYEQADFHFGIDVFYNNYEFLCFRSSAH